jgi:threonine synthase
MTALDEEYDKYSEKELIEKTNSISGIKIPNAISEILEAEVLHNTVCKKDKMKDVVTTILDLK